VTIAETGTRKRLAMLVRLSPRLTRYFTGPSVVVVVLGNADNVLVVPCGARVARGDFAVAQLVRTISDNAGTASIAMNVRATPARAMVEFYRSSRTPLRRT
jgi:hypothetical protein